MTTTITLKSALDGERSCGQMGVTHRCRKYIRDECKEEARQYFLQQQCPPCMSWVCVGENPLSAMGSLEEMEVAHPRETRGPLHVTSASSDRLEDQNDTRTLSRHGGGGGDRGAGGAERTTPPRRPSFSSTGNNAYIDNEVSLEPPARFGHTAVLYQNSKILIFGGKANEERYFNDVYQYDVSARLWSCLQMDSTVDVGRTVVTSEQGSPNSSYASAAPASPFFSSPTASPLVLTRWGEATAEVTPAEPTERNAPSRQNNSHSNNGRGSRENNAIQGAMAAPLSLTAQVHQSTVEGRTLPAGAGSRRDSAARDYNPVPDAGVARHRRPAGRVGHAAALHQDTMYILSGERLGRYFDDMWTLKIPSLTWQKEVSLPFSPRKGHTMHLLPADCTATRARQDMLVVFGGLVKASRARPRPADPELPPRSQGESDFVCAPTNAVLLYYPLQRRWCQLKTCGKQPSGRSYHVSQLITGTALMLVFGGRSATATPTGDSGTTPPDDRFLNDLHILDVSTGVWRQIRDAVGDIPSPRMCAASVFANGTFGLFAGGGDTYCEDAFEFSLHSRRWRRLKLRNQPACSRPTVTYTMGRLVLFGGFAPRTGVMNRTIELCLSPLSLQSQSLLWWNRCAFEKHLRSSTKSRSSEMEEKAASSAAMERAGGSWYTCSNGQVTLQCSPLTTAQSSPLEAPQSRYVNPGLCRPAPLRRPSFEYSGALLTVASAWGGGPPAAPSSVRDAPPQSPTPPYSRSLSAVFSPLSGASQSMSSWQDAGTANAKLPASGLAHASGGGTATAFCSPLSVAPPVTTAFPSCPGTAINSPHCHSRSESPTTAPNVASASQVHLWPHMTPAILHNTPAAGNAVYGGTRSNGTAVYSRANSALAAADASVSTWVSDCTRCCSPPSPSTPAPHSVTSPFACSAAPSYQTAGLLRSSHPPPAPATGEKSTSTCFITNCARNIGGYVAASLPHITGCCWKEAPLPTHAGGQPPAAAVVNCGRTGGTGNTSSGGGCFHFCMRPQPNPLQGRGVRVDVTPLGPSLPPQSTFEPGGGAVGYRQSPPCARPASTIHHNCGGSTSVSPQQQRQTSAHFTESASSRDSSAHSTRSASSISLAHVSNAYAKRTIQRLEGANGPYLLRSLAATWIFHDADVSTDRRPL
ncbi:hypothetical protein JKF63_01542 [Porcisia hertigi]|uniref:Uncharacterized protein n=1 Tax=Porcisia hertigi TaxID=2761500 RepID=A0A836HUY4_9TRYP|nr:hypothetical protein JKF63_01542 [Porcisia hertigi]